MMLLPYKRTRNWLTDTIDVNWRCSDECDDETEVAEKSWDHDYTKPTDVNTVFS
jgi:hypothetical protein